MPERLEKLEYLVKWIAALTAIFVSLRFTYRNMIKPAWQRWKDYEARMEREKIMYSICMQNQASNRFIMDKMSIAWYVADLKGNVTDCSDYACEILETTFQNVHNQNWMQFLLPEEQDRVKKKHDEAVEDKADFIDVYKTYTAKGNIIIVKTHASFIGNGFFGTLEKIN